MIAKEQDDNMIPTTHRFEMYIDHETQLTLHNRDTGFSSTLDIVDVQSLPTQPLYPSTTEAGFLDAYGGADVF